MVIPHVFMQMMTTVCMLTRVLRPFVVGKDTRSAVTVGSIVEQLEIFGLPTVHTRRMDDSWIAFVPTKKREERLIRLKSLLPLVAISVMSCSIA